MLIEKFKELKEYFNIFGTEQRSKRKVRKKFVKDLQDNKITAKEYAKEVPIIIKRKSMQKVISESINRNRFLYGHIRCEEIMDDFNEIILSVREYLTFVLCDLREDYKLVTGLKGENAALKTLTDRTIAEIESVYPWVSDKYYME